jgi:hypothetical protein
MTTFDNTLYIQRLLYATEKLLLGLKTDDESLRWNINANRREADDHLREAIDCLETILCTLGYIPYIKEITQ